jgi:UDP-glucose 4-epimerase
VRFIFSSSATVYGTGCSLPITEDSRGSGPINAYGRTKLWIEEILRDAVAENSIWEIIVLRYFNPIGVHPSGLLREAPVGVPENLVPYILDVVRGGFPELKVFGRDYNTVDGTPVRDYIHVVDLARAHLKALEYKFNDNGESRFQVYNIGTGVGYSVLQVISEFEKLGHRVPYSVVGRRPGDSPATYADSNRAITKLNWVAKYGLEDMVRDACKQLK